MNIMGSKIYLRAIEESDMSLLLKGINDPNLESLIVGSSLPVSTAQQIDWIQNINKNNNSCKLMIQIINGPTIGMCSLDKIDWKNRSAVVGVKIIEHEYRGKGLGVDTEMTLEKYAFEELQLNRLETTILSYNLASQAMYLEKCGWTIEGRLRKAIFKKNEYHDLLIISKLRDEYTK